MGVITGEQLKRIMPKSTRTDEWATVLNTAMERFAINTPHRAAAFLAQLATESGELRRLVENVSYSAERLMKVWPKRFPTLAKAQQYEKNPQKLANHVYANRLGNGDEASGDGWKFRGRGLLQLTGRGNYREVGQAIALPLEAQPELLEELEAAALSAAYFWKSHGLNELADDQSADNDDEDFITICVKVNGGRVGLEERKRYWAQAKHVLGIA